MKEASHSKTQIQVMMSDANPSLLTTWHSQPDAIVDGWRLAPTVQHLQVACHGTTYSIELRIGHLIISSKQPHILGLILQVRIHAALSRMVTNNMMQHLSCAHPR